MRALKCVEVLDKLAVGNFETVKPLLHVAAQFRPTEISGPLNVKPEKTHVDNLWTTCG